MITVHDVFVCKPGNASKLANRAMNEKFKDVNDMYVSGSREIYKIW